MRGLKIINRTGEQEKNMYFSHIKLCLIFRFSLLCLLLFLVNYWTVFLFQDYKIIKQYQRKNNSLVELVTTARQIKQVGITLFEVVTSQNGWTPLIYRPYFEHPVAEGRSLNSL